MDADQLQLGEVAGHRVERNRASDAAARRILCIDHRLPDLHLDRHVQFTALGVEGVVTSMIRRQFEPVRIEVGADKTHVPDCVLEHAHAFHTLGGVDAGQPAKAVGVFLAGAGYDLVRQVVAAGQAHLAGARRDQESPLDAGGIQPLDHLFQGQAAHQRTFRLHLADEEIALPAGAMGQGLRGPDIDDRVDRAVIVFGFGHKPPPFFRRQLSFNRRRLSGEVRNGSEEIPPASE